MPNNLRHKFRYSLAASDYGHVDAPFITFEEPTAKLVGKSMALSFKPTTRADEDIIASRLPVSTGGDSNGQANLPKTLPGYLMGLTAEFTVDGETAKSGVAGRMGGELYEEMGLWSPKDGWETSVNHPTAGSCRAIGLDLQGFSPAQGLRLEDQLSGIKAIFEAGDTSQASSIKKHDLVGGLLNATLHTYFATNDLQDQVDARNAGIISYRLPSYGTFSTNIVTQYWFGLPRNVEFKGLSMDIDHIKLHHVSAINSKADSVAFSKVIGSRMSAMEHVVPEQMFSTETVKAQGISAVKALGLAAQQGQKIWVIDRANVGLALAQINLSAEAENDIRNAVNAGKIATAHETRINFNGWVGEGYTLIDPETGAGAYMIAGGNNGGFLDYIGDNANNFALALGIASVLAVLGGVGGAIFVALVLVTIAVTFLILLATDLQLQAAGCPDTLRMLNALLILIGLIAGLVAGTVGQAIVAGIAGWIYTSIVPSASRLCSITP